MVLTITKFFAPLVILYQKVQKVYCPAKESPIRFQVMSKIKKSNIHSDFKKYCDIQTDRQADMATKEP